MDIGMAPMKVDEHSRSGIYSMEWLAAVTECDLGDNFCSANMYPIHPRFDSGAYYREAECQPT